MNRARRSSLFFGTVGALVLACASPASDSRFAEKAPDQASFPPVAAMLIQACGSLDCHGRTSRALRLYGDTGLRYAATDVPSVLIATTADEIAQDYASVVGLEPELLSQVVAGGGTDPERLTLVQKARGAEDHKGGAVIMPGDPRDACLTSWFAGKADADACSTALSLP